MLTFHRQYLFEPDVFSQPMSDWVEETGEVSEFLLDGLMRHYPSVSVKSARISKLGGFGINSRNWRVETAQGTYALKHVSVGQDAAAVLLQRARTSEALRVKGIPFPAFIPSGDGEVLACTHDAVWAVQPFVDGRYFDGRKADVESSIDVVLRLLSAADAESWRPVGLQGNLTAGDIDSVESLVSDQQEMGRCFGVEVADDIGAIWPVARQYWLDVQESVAGKASIFHIDIHPHNILMTTDDSAVLVDWDSLRLCQRENFLGFAIIKLCRQAMAVDRASACIEQFQAGLGSNYIGIKNFRRLLMSGIAEVLRRLVYILRLNIEGNKAWNHVAPIHIALVREGGVMLEQVR